MTSTGTRLAGLAMSVVVTALLTGCTGRSSSAAPSGTVPGRSSAPAPPQSSAAHGVRTACELVTPAVIAAAHFPDRVVRQVTPSTVGRRGSSLCTFGDDPNPADISPSFLALLVLTPAALAATHRTALGEVEANGYPCTRVELRSFGPDDGFAARAFFCARADHAPDGGWVQGGNAYLLEVGCPAVDYGTVSDRNAEFESVARAIAANVGR